MCTQQCEDYEEGQRQWWPIPTCKVHENDFLRPITTIVFLDYFYSECALKQIYI